MAQQTMYPAKANSPKTELSAAITAAATTIPLVDASKLPAAPNLATIGVDEAAETILYTGISGNSLTGVTRGFNGTTAKSWGQGIKVARYFTAYDHDTFKANIEELAARLTDANTQTTALGPGQNLITASEAGPVAVTVKGNTLVNLLGNYGNFEVDTDGNGTADGWTKYTEAKETALDNLNAKYGSKSQRITAKTSDTGFFRMIERNMPLIAGKRYIAVVDVTIDAGCMARMLFGTTAAGAEKSITSGNYIYVKYAPVEDIPTGKVYLYNYTNVGTAGSVWFDGARVFEIDAATYAKIDVDPEYTGDKLAARYPYVDGVKHTVNPVITKIGKNLLPPFTQWTLHANASADEPYKLTFNPTAAAQNTVDINVLPQTQYTLAVSHNARISVYGNQTSADIVAVTASQSVTFNTGINTSVKVSLRSMSAGTFTFSNPQLELGATATPFEPRNDDYLYALTTLAGYGGVNDVLTVRGAEATVLRRCKRINFNGTEAWQYRNDNGTYITASLEFASVAPYKKEIGVTNFIVSYEGSEVIPVIGAISSAAEANLDRLLATLHGANSVTTGVIYITILKSALSTQDAAGVKSFLSAKAAASTPLTLDYVLSTPVTEVVPVEGSLANHAGANLYEVGEGVIVREKATPQQVISGSGAWYINEKEIYTSPDSPLKNRTNVILSVSKNGSYDPAWVFGNSQDNKNGIAFARIENSNFDPTAEYTVTYLALDKYLLTAPVVEGALEYKNNLAGVLSETVKQMADNNTRDTIQDGRLLLDEAYIRNFNLDLSAATPNPTASTLMKRDSAGRAQVAAPSVAADIANKGYVDTGLTAVQTRADDAYSRADQAFTQASNGKTVIAAAITGMGQAASGSDTFTQLAAKVGDISKDANATVGEVLSGKTFYQGGTKKTGTMPNRGAPTWTPGTGNQGLSAGYYEGGTVLGDPDLIASNIRNGVDIFGVVGSLIEGRPYATGSLTSTTTVTVSGLSFRPQFILVRGGYNGEVETHVYAPNSMTVPGNRDANMWGYRLWRNTTTTDIQPNDTTGYPWTINNDGFSKPVSNASSPFTWWAFG